MSGHSRQALYPTATPVTTNARGARPCHRRC